MLLILKVIFLFGGILLTNYNTLRILTEKSIPVANVFWQAGCITGFIYLQWL